MPVYTDEELNEQREKYFTSCIRRGYGIYDGYTMPISFGNIREDIEEMEVFDDDVWVCSFPKCGTTWTQEMVWCICNDLNFNAAMKEDIDTRFPFLELCCIAFPEKPMLVHSDIVMKSVEIAKNLKRPRFIKTHLPWELLPKQIRNFERRPKIIHVTRNPMDTCVSFFYHSKFLDQFLGDFDLFVQLFLNHKVIYTPYDKTVLSYWNRRNEPNVLFLKFEDLKSDLSTVVDTVAKFLNVTLPEEGKTKLLSHLSFESMKKNDSANHSKSVEYLQKNDLIYDKEGTFIRKGMSGGYLSEMSEEIIDVFKKKFVEKLEKDGLNFSM